jgi:hypothetical protein
MSTAYRLEEKVSAHDLLCGRLATFGVREHVASDTSERRRCLTDGNNYLWVCLTEDGFVSTLTRYRGNAPGKILAAISEAFETDIFNEHEPEYWGFDTKEEWDVAWKKISDEHRDQFYANVCAYIRGEPNGINPHPVCETQAKIAKTLVEGHAALLQLENKDTLLA